MYQKTSTRGVALALVFCLVADPSTVLGMENVFNGAPAFSLAHFRDVVSSKNLFEAQAFALPETTTRQEIKKQPLIGKLEREHIVSENMPTEVAVRAALHTPTALLRIADDLAQLIQSGYDDAVSNYFLYLGLHLEAVAHPSLDQREKSINLAKLRTFLWGMSAAIQSEHHNRHFPDLSDIGEKLRTGAYHVIHAPDIETFATNRITRRFGQEPTAEPDPVLVRSDNYVDVSMNTTRSTDVDVHESGVAIVTVPKKHSVRVRTDAVMSCSLIAVRGVGPNGRPALALAHVLQKQKFGNGEYNRELFPADETERVMNALVNYMAGHGWTDLQVIVQYDPSDIAGTKRPELTAENQKSARLIKLRERVASPEQASAKNPLGLASTRAIATTEGVTLYDSVDDHEVRPPLTIPWESVRYGFRSLIPKMQTGVPRNIAPLCAA